MRAFLAGATLILAQSAQAQDGEVANNAAFGDWVVTCEAVSTQRTTCRIVQSQSRTETGALVLQLLGYPAADEGMILVAQVPIGSYLANDIAFRAEADADAPAQTLVWQRCLNQICEAALALDAEGVANLAGAGAVLFGYQPGPGSEPLITRVDTSTMMEALEAARPKSAE